MCKIFLKSIHKCRGYAPDENNHLTFDCNLDLGHIETNLSQDTSTCLGEQMCKVFFLNLSINA